LYGTNSDNLMQLLPPGKDGQMVLDFDDVFQRNMTVVREGEVTWPPPPVEVSAAPQAEPVPEARPAAPTQAQGPKLTDAGRYAVVGVGALALFWLRQSAPTR